MSYKTFYKLNMIYSINQIYMQYKSYKLDKSHQQINKIYNIIMFINAHYLLYFYRKYIR